MWRLPMKTLEVYADFLPKTGGVSMHILDLGRALLDRGHTPVVLVWEPPKPTSEVIDKIIVQRFHMPALFAKRRYVKLVYLVMQVMLTSIRYDINLIHGHDYFPGLASVLAGKFLSIPVVVTFHLPIERTSWKVRRRFHPTNLAERFLQKVFIHYVNIIICVSKYTYAETLKLGFPKDKLRVMYNWVRQPCESAAENKNEILKKFDLHQKRFALSVGRLDEHQKAFSMLIRSFRILADKGYDLDLVIVGEGPAETAYRRLSAELGLLSRIHLTGTVEDYDLITLYEKCDLFVLSSFFEALPLVVLEAMSFGKPVVATNVGGLSEIINSGYNGLLVKPEQESIAAGIETLLSPPDMMRKFAQRAKETVIKKFSKQNCYETIKLLETFAQDSCPAESSVRENTQWRNPLVEIERRISTEKNN